MATFEDDRTSGRLLKDSEAESYLSLAPGTLAVWRCTKRYHLPYIKVGRSVRYRRSALEDWLKSREVSVTPGGRENRGKHQMEPSFGSKARVTKRSRA